MNLAIPYIDRIWRVEDQLVLDEQLTPEEVFTRIAPLFDTPRTEVAVEGDAIAYVKRNPAAQDKLATFTRGTLRVEQAGGRTRLVYSVASTALLLTFLAPLLFLGFAQLAGQINAWENAKAEAAAEKAADKAEDKDKKKKIELHPIDVMLGAPAPKDPDADKADKNKKKEPKEKIRTTPAYVLAGLFLAIFLVGRVLEPYLLKRTFRRMLTTVSPEEVAGGSLQDEPATG